MSGYDDANDDDERLLSPPRPSAAPVALQTHLASFEHGFGGAYEFRSMSIASGSSVVVGDAEPNSTAVTKVAATTASEDGLLPSTRRLRASL